MAVPVSYPSATPTYSLPLLFSGQAQKEFFLNQSFSVIDALLQLSVIASIATPPTDPSEGACYRVMAPAVEAWAGHEDSIAIFIAGSWVFVEPVQGMTIYDREVGALAHFNSGWLTATEPNQPTSGTTVDSEARQTLSELIDALRGIGVFANPI